MTLKSHGSVTNPCFTARRYGAGGREMEDDIRSVLLVPRATKLHRDSRHRLLREGLVAAPARHHSPLRPALRTLVVRLLRVAAMFCFRII